MDNIGQDSYDNLAYQHDNINSKEPPRNSMDTKRSIELDPEKATAKTRTMWGNGIEFLMSCIAVSVGFGNIWRFPFTAYENGGGAFLIPYIILLFLVGKPFYFLEMIIGQFSGSSPINVWRLCPGFVGVAWAQICSITGVVSYYSSLMALTLFFLIASFTTELPWAKCRKEWGDYCVDSSTKTSHANASMIEAKTNPAYYEALNKLKLLAASNEHRSSAELYFTKVVLQEKDNIDDGIGLPNWKLTLCLFGSWLVICLVTFRGVKSSGKASYFLAIFPYIILFMLLVRATTLEGAGTGILFFITPQWSKLTEPRVWYAAVTQCFFSLSVCFGSIITYSSHNDFKQNIGRDVLIVTTLDTVTSTLAGCTIFGILGNLAFEMGVNDIDMVVKSGAALAFVSYPDAIAKFNLMPQVFSVLFFVMMFVLGVGSAVGMVSAIIDMLKEKFPNFKTWKIVILVCLLGFCISTVYVTPGGQFILTLVDFYGASFIVFILASFEMIGIIWVYGLENFLNDVEFMLDRKVNVYWRICWFIITPSLLIIIFIYTVATVSPLTYAGKHFPTSAHVAGTILLCFGACQIPFWMLIEMLKNQNLPIPQMIKQTFRPAANWGPADVEYKSDWLLFKEEKAKEKNMRTQASWYQILCILLRIKPK
ncbi:hypothetical protein KM043_011403 [Ampulex compressa]|nr:hypothetical protein KM043_011403 [Ampulex compressa]